MKCAIEIQVTIEDRIDYASNGKDLQDALKMTAEHKCPELKIYIITNKQHAHRPITHALENERWRQRSVLLFF
jgi:hypothetical protein